MSRRKRRRPVPTTDQRTPDERLEALVREPNLDRAERMIERILDDLEVNPEPGPWIAAARTLSERLIISQNTLYHLVETFTECVMVAASRTDADLLRLSTELREIEAAHGLREDQLWRVDEAPPEWLALSSAWGKRANALVAASLRDLGHPDIAALLEENRAEFSRRANEGGDELWGEEEPED